MFGLLESMFIFFLIQYIAHSIWYRVFREIRSKRILLCKILRLRQIAAAIASFPPQCDPKHKVLFISWERPFTIPLLHINVTRAFL